MKNQTTQQFLKETIQNKKVSERKFWEFREFIAPGSFVFKREGFSKQETTKRLALFNTDIHWPEGTIHFLNYDSDQIHSAEFLVTGNKITDAVKEPGQDAAEILLQTETDFLYRTKDGTLKLIFIRPLEVMKETNGFYDYNGYDKERVKDKSWLVISTIAE